MLLYTKLMMSENLSVFWVPIDSVDPNPFQPRHKFDDNKLIELSQSIKRYGVLQPLVVTRKEESLPGGDISIRYQLIAGERRLRASKLANLREVPVVVRQDVDDSVKLELAIIENLQREDLTPIDRARAFKQLHESFSLKHSEISEKIGRSREYISNSIRLLNLPMLIIEALQAGKLSEGHARSLLMLENRPEEQMTLFQDVLFRKLTVRETEQLARRTAVERARKPVSFDMINKEEEISRILGVRFQIQEKNQDSGKITIAYETKDELETILSKIKGEGEIKEEGETETKVKEEVKEKEEEEDNSDFDDDLYGIQNFSL